MIDTMLFIGNFPIGTYAVGDKITFTQIAGPTVVRDGLGTATLKAINSGSILWASESKPAVRYKVKNSNWNDPIYNGASSLADSNGLNENSVGYQNGNDCVLQVNSAFEVEAECFQAITTTGDNSLFVAIDIEYSGLTGVQDPRKEVGTPCSLVYDMGTVPYTAGAGFSTGTWTEISFDKFKAGYRYLLQKISLQVSQGSSFGFIKISGGATMGGLTRIIPVSSQNSAVGRVITYTAPEVKGPFTMGVMLLNSTGNATDSSITCDYVKRG